MTAAPGSKIPVLAALIILASAAVTAAAPTGNAAGCGTDFADFHGEFTAQEDAQNSLRFDDDGGITFRSPRYGVGDGIYALVPSGGFSAAIRMTEIGADDARAGNVTGMVKSTTLACGAPSSQVTSFTSLDQSSRRFNYTRQG
ncbi:hypothetical protein AB0N05_14380 [Nocardia sp. NPDC051030]|uniref:hypothetical protein n=1 Tax=Nocardia sp. NPDC051030 TaxID=3155162 RepID=UPI00342A57BB